MGLGGQVRFVGVQWTDGALTTFVDDPAVATGVFRALAEGASGVLPRRANAISCVVVCWGTKRRFLVSRVIAIQLKVIATDDHVSLRPVGAAL